LHGGLEPQVRTVKKGTVWVVTPADLLFNGIKNG